MSATHITIAAVGDIMFHDPQIDHAWNGHEYDFSPTFANVRDILRSADFAVGNFECVTAGARFGYRGFPCFNAPDTVLSAVADAGFDLLFTSNNHCLDQGTVGIENTLAQIHRFGMASVGTDIPGQPRVASVVKDIDGVRFGFMAYTYGVNGNEWKVQGHDLSEWVHVIDKGRILWDLDQLRQQHPDFIVVFMHWGEEYMQHPLPEQGELADFLFTHGVDIVLGSHPHVLQTADSRMIEGRPHWVIYSMGNFVSNQRMETVGDARTEDGVIVLLHFTKLGAERRFSGVDFVPTWVDKHTEGTRIVYAIKPITGNPQIPRMEASKLRTEQTLGIISSR